MEGYGKPWNLDNFAAVIRGILQTALWNLAQNRPWKTVGPTHLYVFFDWAVTCASSVFSKAVLYQHVRVTVIVQLWIELFVFY